MVVVLRHSEFGEERNPCEGPVARLDTCLCMLLCIIPLVLNNLIKEENTQLEFSQREDKQASISCCHELVSCLQQLGEYECLLTPPPSITSSRIRLQSKQFWISRASISALDTLILSVSVTCQLHVLVIYTI